MIPAVQGYLVKNNNRIGILDAALEFLGRRANRHSTLAKPAKIVSSGSTGGAI